MRAAWTALWASVLVHLALAMGGEVTGELSETLECLNRYMDSLQDKMSSRLFTIFKKAYPNTLTTTIQHYDLTPGKEATYIITGDIEAMWLRDSTNQFLPYIRIPEECPHIRALARGLINTQADFIMIDPYTNAFKKFEKAEAKRHFYLNDKTTVLIMGIAVDLTRNREYATKSIWERKFQIDSLASFLRLAYEYQNKYGTIDFVNLGFLRALKRIMHVIDEQTKDKLYEKATHKRFYSFVRDARELAGGEIKPSLKTGMIKTGFRPSDDPNDMAYNIPGNAMLVTYMELVATKVLRFIPQSSVLHNQANILADKMVSTAAQIKQAIFDYGLTTVNGKKILAYQVNGKGESRSFDDANLPSLLSLPYLQFIDVKDELYVNTRSHLLSPSNPYYFEKNQYKGIGSSHTPNRHVWPLAVITQIFTTEDSDQIKTCLENLEAQANDDLIHESYNIDRPASITRPWFAWANSLFGQMIIKLATTRPQVLK